MAKFYNTDSNGFSHVKRGGNKMNGLQNLFSKQDDVHSLIAGIDKGGGGGRA